MQPPATMGVYGGSFDPVHLGHLRAALEVQQLLELDEIRFLPSGRPPHRDAPEADDALRLRMLAAAIGDQPGFVVDERELQRRGPSYTVTTLETLRADFPETSLLLIVGMDAFLGLPDWHRWQELFELAHLVVAHRPGWQPPASGPLGDLLAARSCDSRERFLSGSGCIYVHAITALDIASSEIRAAVGRGESIRYLVPDRVRDIIVDSGCYEPDDSSIVNNGGLLSAKR
jgi:nicotinate-nucleotide adenylyltransferase